VGRERVVSLDAGTVGGLRGHRRQQLADIDVARAAWIDTGRVFANGLGRPIYPDAVSQLMAKSIKADNEPGDPDGPASSAVVTRKAARPPPRPRDDAAASWGARACRG